MKKFFSILGILIYPTMMVQGHGPTDHGEAYQLSRALAQNSIPPPTPQAISSSAVAEPGASGQPKQKFSSDTAKAARKLALPTTPNVPTFLNGNINAVSLNENSDFLFRLATNFIIENSSGSNTERFALSAGAQERITLANNGALSFFSQIDGIAGHDAPIDFPTNQVQVAAHNFYYDDTQGRRTYERLINTNQFDLDYFELILKYANRC